MVLAQNYNGVILNKIDYKSAGVDIDAGNEAVEKIKDKVSANKNDTTWLLVQDEQKTPIARKIAAIRYSPI